MPTGVDMNIISIMRGCAKSAAPTQHNTGQTACFLVLTRRHGESGRGVEGGGEVVAMEGSEIYIINLNCMHSLGMRSGDGGQTR